MLFMLREDIPLFSSFFSNVTSIPVIKKVDKDEKAINDRLNLNKTKEEENSINWKDSYPKADLNSRFYNKDNAFKDVLLDEKQETWIVNRNTSVWYVYGRVLELESQGVSSLYNIKTKMENSFLNKTGRFAQSWAEKLNLINGKIVLPQKDRKKGLLAIWECTININKHGHIGFVEEILQDGTKYRLSDFDRFGRIGSIDGEPRNNIYTFPNSNTDAREENGYLPPEGVEGGCLPTFYKLTP